MSITKTNEFEDPSDVSPARATDLAALEMTVASARYQLGSAETELKNVGRSGDTQAMLAAAESVKAKRRAVSRAETTLTSAAWEARSAERVEASAALSTAIESALDHIDLELCATLGIRGATIIFDEDSGDFSVKVDTVGAKAAKIPSPRRTRRTNSDVILRRQGIIAPETRIGVIVNKLPIDANPEDRKFTARFAHDAKKVIWDLDDEEKPVSISRLARDLERYGVKADNDSENGFRVFGLDSDRSISLEDLRKKIEGRL